MAWKTYLVLHFGTKVPMSDILKKVESTGFQTTLGPVDFIHQWQKEPKKEDIAKLGDKLVLALKDTGCVFNLDTHD